MGFKVGMPVLKLKRSGAKGKRAGNLASILVEAGEERRSKSQTFDKSRSQYNQHLGMYSKGLEAYNAIMQECEKYEDRLKADPNTYLGRGLRKDATVAVALIIHPPQEMMQQIMEEGGRQKVERFFEDSWDCLKELNVIKDEKHVMLRERHWDEATPHEHVVYMAYDDEGKIAGSRVANLAMFKKLNRDYPKMMRDKGWDVDELRAYDSEKVKDMGEEEKREYKRKHIEAKRGKHGKSVNEFIGEKKFKEASEQLEDVRKLREKWEEMHAWNESRNKELEEKEENLKNWQTLLGREKERVIREVKEQAQSEAQDILYNARAQALSMRMEAQDSLKEVNKNKENLQLLQASIKEQQDSLLRQQTQINKQEEELREEKEEIKEKSERLKKMKVLKDEQATEAREMLKEIEDLKKFLYGQKENENTRRIRQVESRFGDIVSKSNDWQMDL